MTEAQLQKYIDDLWEKHGHPDKHGYKDWMSPNGFADAVKQVLKDAEAKP